jgi:hypothetical protein
MVEKDLSFPFELDCFLTPCFAGLGAEIKWHLGQDRIVRIQWPEGKLKNVWGSSKGAIRPF